MFDVCDVWFDVCMLVCVRCVLCAAWMLVYVCDVQCVHARTCVHCLVFEYSRAWVHALSVCSRACAGKSGGRGSQCSKPICHNQQSKPVHHSRTSQHSNPTPQPQHMEMTHVLLNRCIYTTQLLAPAQLPSAICQAITCAQHACPRFMHAAWKCSRASHLSLCVHWGTMHTLAAMLGMTDHAPRHVNTCMHIYKHAHAYTHAHQTTHSNSIHTHVHTHHAAYAPCGWWLCICRVMQRGSRWLLPSFAPHQFGSVLSSMAALRIIPLSGELAPQVINRRELMLMGGDGRGP